MIWLFFYATAFGCTHLGYMDQCSDHGICAFDAAINTTRCVCTWSFAGDVCNETATTALATVVQTTALPQKSIPTTTLPQTKVVCTHLGFMDQCSDHGICAFDANLNTTRCVCTAPFTGETCNFEATTKVTMLMMPKTEATTSSTLETTAASQATSSVTPSATATTATATMLVSSPFSSICDRFDTRACSEHGQCEQGVNNGFYCKCDNMYTGQQCEKQEKSKWIAFALSFFLGSWGAERFYLGYIGLGVLKLLMGMIGCYGFCVCGCVGMTQMENNEGAAAVFFGLGICIVITLFAADGIWWLVDWIMILADSLPDAAGNALVG